MSPGRTYEAHLYFFVAHLIYPYCIFYPCQSLYNISVKNITKPINIKGFLGFEVGICGLLFLNFSNTKNKIVVCLL